MTEIDPLQLTAADWDQVGATLGFLWVFWLSVVGAALLLLTGPRNHPLPHYNGTPRATI